MDITLVTCWYTLKSKLPKEEYTQWIQYFFKHVQTIQVVVYTNRESYAWLEPYITPSIKVIFKEFQAFHTWDNKDQWIANHAKNDLLNNKSRWDVDWRLNMLWSEKIHFVKEVKDKYGDTQYYGWCDIGYFRHDKTPLHWPRLQHLKKDKLYYGVPGSRTTLNQLIHLILDKNEQNMPTIPIPPGQVSIAGGFFLSHRQNIDWWHNVYYNRLKDYFKHDYVVKDDQIIIIDCIVHHLNRFELVEETNPHKDRWFVFQSVLS